MTRREEHYRNVGSRAVEIKVQGRRKRGRSNITWLNRVSDDSKETVLSGEKVYNRATWSCVSTDTKVVFRTSSSCTCVGLWTTNMQCSHGAGRRQETVCYHIG